MGVSVYSCFYAATLLVIAAPVVAVMTDSPAVQMPTTGELIAIVYLGLMVTAVAFLAWYTSVSRLGSERAGPLSGLMPVSALVGGIVLGNGGATTPAVVGVMVVGAGVVVSVVAGSGRRDAAPAIEPEPTHTAGDRARVSARSA